MELPESAESAEGTPGLDRRNVLRRGAVLGGALVWTVPAVQTLSGAAFAAGSPLCSVEVRFIDAGGVCQKVVFTPSASCCNCVAAQQGPPNNFPLPIAIAVCIANASCTPAGPPTAC